MLRRFLVCCALASCATREPRVDIIATADPRIAAVHVTAGTLSTELVLANGTYDGSFAAAFASEIHATAVDAAGVEVASIRTARIAADDGAVVLLHLTAAKPTPQNHAPVIDAIVASAQVVAPSGQVSLAATVHDPDGDPVTLSWSGPGTFSAPTSASTSWTAPAKSQTAKLTLTVSDRLNAKATASITIEVTAGTGSVKVTASFQSAPEVDEMVLASGRLLPGATTTVDAVATDPDHDSLTYAWSNDCGASLTGTGKRVSVLLPTSTTATTCSLHVHIDDGHGSSNEGELDVLVGSPAPPNFAPIIDATFQSVDRVAPGEQVVLRADAHDPDGDPITFAWSSSRGVIGNKTDTSTSSAITWTAPPACFSGVADVALAVSSATQTTTVTFEIVGRDATCP